MTDAQRAAFGALLTEIRMSRFEGNRLAAYTAAKVNSATWSRAEEGLSIKEGTVAKILINLLPRTGGDWQKLLDKRGNFHLNYWDRNEILPQDAGDIERVLGVPEGTGSDDVHDWPEASRELRAVQTRLAQLEYRLGKLEEHLEFNPFEGWELETAEEGASRPNYFPVDDATEGESAAALDDADNPPGAPADDTP